MADDTTQQEWPDGHEPATQEELDELQRQKIELHEQKVAEAGEAGDSSDASETAAPAGDTSVTAGSQPHETDPPTHPAESGGGPGDALAGPQPPEATGGVPATVEGDGPAGPEDALDPAAENRGAYSDQPGRIDDAAHYHHEPVPVEEQTPDGPRSRPVPQNELAEQALGTVGETVQGADPAADAQAKVAAEQEQLHRSEPAGDSE